MCGLAENVSGGAQAEDLAFEEPNALLAVIGPLLGSSRRRLSVDIVCVSSDPLSFGSIKQRCEHSRGG